MPTGLRLLILAVISGHCLASHPVRADTAPPPLRAADDLDGVYIALGPIGSAVYTQGSWDGGFGGELALVRIREEAPLTALGLGLGGIRLSLADHSRLWADLQLGSRRPLGWVMGVSAGVAAEIDPVIPMRWGAQATIWVFAGVIPYVRMGVVQKSGTYVDIGIKIALPAFRM